MAQIFNMFDNPDDEHAVEEEENLDQEEPSVQKRVPRDYAKQGDRPTTTTRGRERMVEEVPGTPEPEPAYQLVSTFDNKGAPFVALAVNGQRIEQWRQPTQEEWQILQTRGRLVKGGIGETPVAQPAPVATVATTTVSGGMGAMMPKLIVGGALLAAAGVAFHFYRQAKEMEDNVEELD